MAYAFHLDSELKFDQLHHTTSRYILPYIRQYVPIGPGTRILDVGCGTGGVLKSFLEAGATVLGVDFNAGSVGVANRRFAQEVQEGRARFQVKDVYDFEENEVFDLIILKDAIEHIHNQERIIRHLKKFLLPGGKIFFGFPPWLMPFGGHQQIIRNNKKLSKLPYFHWLPKPLFMEVLRTGGVSEKIQADLSEIYDTGISTARFETIVKSVGYRIVNRQVFFVNPNYEIKFGLNPRKQWSWLSKLPYLRDILGTAAYYVIAPRVYEQPALGEQPAQETYLRELTPSLETQVFPA